MAKGRQPSSTPSGDPTSTKVTTLMQCRRHGSSQRSGFPDEQPCRVCADSRPIGVAHSVGPYLLPRFIRTRSSSDLVARMPSNSGMSDPTYSIPT